VFSQKALPSVVSFLSFAQEWLPWKLWIWLVMLWWLSLVKPCGRFSLAFRLRVISPWLKSNQKKLLYFG
jgi:hypothetical protein